MTRTVPLSKWQEIAAALGVEEAALRAIAEVESRGDGFLPPPDNRPKVLFEAHIFSRRTDRRYDQSHPTLSFPRWNRALYSPTAKGEWERLNAAMALDETAAMMSASWGTLQIMGFNFKACGCKDVHEFVAQMITGAVEQATLFAEYLKSTNNLIPAIKALNWPEIARIYNGPEYAVNRYDAKMKAAYLRIKPTDKTA